MLTAESVPNTALPKTGAGGTGKPGKPLSSVVKVAPAFRFLISAVKFEVAPAQIELGFAKISSCNQVVIGTVAVRTSLATGPELTPHQLSFALSEPPLRKIARPLVATGTVLAKNREKVTFVPDPPEVTAPPVIAALFDANELVVIVSGPPLSTMIAPPLPFAAVLPVNDELLML